MFRILCAQSERCLKKIRFWSKDFSDPGVKHQDDSESAQD